MELRLCELCKSVNEKCNCYAGTAAYLCFVAGHSPTINIIAKNKLIRRKS